MLSEKHDVEMMSQQTDPRQHSGDGVPVLAPVIRHHAVCFSFFVPNDAPPLITSFVFMLPLFPSASLVLLPQMSLYTPLSFSLSLILSSSTSVLLKDN